VKVVPSHPTHASVQCPSRLSESLTLALKIIWEEPVDTCFVLISNAVYEDYWKSKYVVHELHLRKFD
jgi:hypothetical protein